MALPEIINEDATIDNENSSGFEKYIGTKECLNSKREFISLDLLAGILLYTIREIDNKVGRECVKLITKDYISRIHELSDKKTK